MPIAAPHVDREGRVRLDYVLSGSNGGLPMTPKKTLQQREKELQALLNSPAGQEELRELDARYRAASGRLRPSKTSIITYILVNERDHGLISD